MKDGERIPVRIMVLKDGTRVLAPESVRLLLEILPDHETADMEAYVGNNLSTFVSRASEWLLNRFPVAPNGTEYTC